MSNLPASYDEWRLSVPERPYLGSKPGDTCNRIAEPCEDAPRGYRPRPCRGEMIVQCSVTVCDTCGENGDE